MERHQKQKLLKLSRVLLENRLINTSHNLKQYKEKVFEQKQGVFVTLHLNGELNGCMGHIEATESIYENVIHLSQAAAFEDIRFASLTAEDLRDLNIEISILSIPKKLSANSNRELIQQIRPGIDGVILYTGYHSAMFLPQVWEQIPDRESFVDQLCRKAGQSMDYWRSNPIEVLVYQVECFEEKYEP